MPFNETITALETEFQIINPVLNTIVITILIFLVGFIAGKIAGKLVSWLLKQIKADFYVKKGFKLAIPVQKGASIIISYAIYIFAILLALQQLKVVSSVFYILLGAVLIFALMSLLISIKDFLPNLLAGLYLRRRKLFRENDKITYAGMPGTIQQIGLLHTELLTPEKELLLIPNSAFKKGILKKRR